jgi:hypothetical protein
MGGRKGPSLLYHGSEDITFRTLKSFNNLFSCSINVSTPYSIALLKFKSSKLAKETAENVFLEQKAAYLKYS